MIRFYKKKLKIGEKVFLESAQYPKFVRFKELDNPKSVAEVHSFEAFFGEGVRLKSVTVEITEEDVTWRVSKDLSWLKDLNGGYLGGSRSSRGAPLGLHAGDFQIGAKAREK